MTAEEYALVYARAVELCGYYYNADIRDETPDTALFGIREDIRTDLLEEFEEIDGPDIASAMDDALSAQGFPLERC